jgi:hypothetical protein
MACSRNRPLGQKSSNQNLHRPQCRFCTRGINFRIGTFFTNETLASAISLIQKAILMSEGMASQVQILPTSSEKEQ